MKTVWYYIKQMFLPIMYTIFAAMIAFGILCIQGMDWLKIILLILNIALFAFIICANYFKEGEKAYKVRLANDLEREMIIRTGEDRPIDRNGEYKPWKGFVMGVISCAPLIILMIIHAIIIFFINPEKEVVGGITAFIYMSFFGLFWLDTSIALSGVAYFACLIYVPALVTFMGVPYILGARKIEIQQQMIKEKHRQIYGE